MVVRPGGMSPAIYGDWFPRRNARTRLLAASQEGGGEAGAGTTIIW